MKKLLLVQGLVSLVLGYDTGPIRPNVQIHAERLRRQRLRRVVLLDAQAILQRAVTDDAGTVQGRRRRHRTVVTVASAFPVAAARGRCPRRGRLLHRRSSRLFVALAPAFLRLHVTVST